MSYREVHVVEVKEVVRLVDEVKNFTPKAWKAATLSAAEPA
jgi:hypothetical protein